MQSMPAFVELCSRVAAAIWSANVSSVVADVRTNMSPAVLAFSVTPLSFALSEDSVVGVNPSGAELDPVAIHPEGNLAVD